MVTIILGVVYQNGRLNDINKRIDDLGTLVNKRIDDLRDSINKRIDSLESPIVRR
jgi:hypothetical protein